MTDEVKRLCNEIKRLVPPAIPQAPTGPFQTFMNEIGPKITKPELDSIHRAYNYCNRLGEIDLHTVTGSSTGTPGSSADGKSSESSKPAGSVESTDKDAEEMIHILLQLMEREPPA
jgi:hypothetical protein